MSKIVKSLSLTTQASLLAFNSLAQTPDQPKQTAKSGTTVHKTAHNAKSETPTKELSEQVNTLQSKLDTRSFVRPAFGYSQAGEARMSGATLPGRPVRESRSEYTQVTLPNDANPFGNVLGGHIMHLIDLCGGLAARRHSRRPVVTASVDHISFLHPVHIGEYLILKSSPNRAFNSSMEIGVKVWVEDAITGEVHHTSSAYLTFVALDENGKPVSVAPVVPETEDEKRRFEEAGRRRESRLRARAEQNMEKAEQPELLVPQS